MRLFEQVPPEHQYTMMLFVVFAWMTGRSMVIHYVTPLTADVMGACGLALTMCAIMIGEMTREK